MNGATNSRGRVVHISTGKFLRGGERQALLLHNGLMGKGRESFFICRSSGACAREESPNLLPTPWLGEWDIPAAFRIIAQCTAISPCLIHCHDAHALSHGAIAALVSQTPLVYTRRVAFPLHGTMFSQWKYKRCARVIAVSAEVARQCATITQSDKISVIHDGVDWEKPTLPRAEARAALGLAQDNIIIGTVGYFTQEKNLPFILALAHELRAVRPAVRIVCIGPADVDSASYPENLIITGIKPNAVSLYSAFDMYVSAATREGLGSALLDAVVRDIPTIAVNAGGTPDIYPTGWPLVSPDDESGFITAVLHAIDDIPSARAAAVQCGIRARNLFSVDTMVKQTLDLYRDLLRN